MTLGGVGVGHSAIDGLKGVGGVGERRWVGLTAIGELHGGCPFVDWVVLNILYFLGWLSEQVRFFS